MLAESRTRRTSSWALGRRGEGATWWLSARVWAVGTGRAPLAEYVYVRVAMDREQTDPQLMDREQAADHEQTDPQLWIENAN